MESVTLSSMEDAIARAIALLDRSLGARAVAIWVFGSMANGTGGAGSDLDLAVLAYPSLGMWERAALMDTIAASS